MVIDNRSPDQTLEVAIEYGKEFLTQSSFIAWRNESNYGLGGSHKAAFCYAIEHGFDHIVVLHGDDQADIHDLIPLLETGAHLDVDCLLGARFMMGSKLKGYSWFRTFGNQIYNVLFSLVVGRPIYDLGSGLNMYCLNAFREYYFMNFPDDLTFNYVMLLASYYHNHKVRFFPISWREEDQVSNVKIFYQAFKVLGLLAGFALKRSRFLESDLRKQPFEAYTGQVCYRYEKQIT